MNLYIIKTKDGDNEALFGAETAESARAEIEHITGEEYSPEQVILVQDRSGYCSQISADGMTLGEAHMLYIKLLAPMPGVTMMSDAV